MLKRTLVTSFLVLIHLLAAASSGSNASIDVPIQFSPDQIFNAKRVASFVEGNEVPDLTDLLIYRYDHESFLWHLRSAPYGDLFIEECRKQGVDPYLGWSVAVVESSLRPNALSEKGAVGLMQVMPSTAGLPSASLFHPKMNVRSGCRYLKKLVVRFNGDLDLVLSAYNAGPTLVERLGRIPRIEETRSYVRKVKEVYLRETKHKWRETGRVEEILILSKVINIENEGS